MLELYHWEPNTNAARVMICLAEKGLVYTSRYVDLLKLEQFSPDFLALNPFGQVPVLVHDGHALRESCVINEFLEEAFPETSLAPRDSLGWYNVQIWSKYIDYNLGTSISTLGWHRVMTASISQKVMQDLKQKVGDIPVKERQMAWEAAVAGATPEEQLENSRRKIKLVIQRMEDVLGNSDWLVGDDYSLADIDTYALAHSLPQLLPEIVNPEVSPCTMHWLQRIGERPAVKTVMAKAKTDYLPAAYAPGPEHSRWG